MDEDQTSIYLSKHFFRTLNKFREDDRLTDFAICVDKQIIRAHKFVLAANSDYFKAMLTNNSSELNRCQVTLKDVDPETIKIIIDFWYTGEIKLTSENVCSLLLVGSRFQAKTVLEVSKKFAAANLTATNCLNIAVLCERCNFIELGQKAFICCLNQFENIIQDPELLCLDQEFFTKLISDDTLAVKDEIVVFQAIVNWVKFDETSRSSQFKHLMREVRFASIDPVCLVEPRVKKLVEISEQYREIVLKAIGMLLLKRYPELYQESDGKFNSKPRRPLSYAERDRRLYVLGGMGPKSDSKRKDCEVYDPSADRWSCLPDMKENVAQNLAFTSSGWDQIYAPSSIDMNTCQQYELDTNEWSYSQLIFYRPNCAFILPLDHCIYSFDGNGRSVFKYDREKKTTSIFHSFREPRVSPGFAVHNQHIYLLGGSKIGSEDGMNFVERYDTKDGKWKTVASMKRPRVSFGSCSYRGKIYVAGGVSRGECIQQAEVYDPKLNTWTEIKPMSQARAYFGLVELLGQLYAVGGRNEDDVLDEVEAYDTDSNTWIQKKPMNGKRYGACVLVTRKGNITIPRITE